MTFYWVHSILTLFDKIILSNHKNDMSQIKMLGSDSFDDDVFEDMDEEEHIEKEIEAEKVRNF